MVERGWVGVRKRILNLTFDLCSRLPNFSYLCRVNLNLYFRWIMV